MFLNSHKEYITREMGKKYAISRFTDKDNFLISYFAPIKKVRIEQDGSLWLVYWQGNDKLKKIPVEMKYGKTVNKNGINIRMTENSLNANDGCVIEGIMNLEENPGLYFECLGDKSAYMAVNKNAEISYYIVSETGNTPDISFLPEKYKVQSDRQFGKTVQFRVLLKKHVMEIYFDDIYMSSYSLPGDSTGKAGLTGTENSVTAIKSWNVY